MTSEVVNGGDKRKSAWGLYIILGILCVAIVGLGVMVLVIGSSYNRSDDDGGSHEETVFDDHYDRATTESNCTDRDEYNGIMLCIENDYYLHNQDLDKAVSRYKNVIQEKAEKDERELAMQLLIAMVHFYFAETEDCDAVLGIIDGQDLADFSDRDKLHFYAEAEELAYECGNPEKQLSYEGFYREVYAGANLEAVDGGDE